MMSPTSILDSKSFSGLKNPFSPRRSQAEPVLGNLDSPKIGLGLVDVLFSDQNKSPLNSSTKLPAESRMVLLESQLKIQIPSSLLSSRLLPQQQGLPPDLRPISGSRRGTLNWAVSFSSSGLSPSLVLKSTTFGSSPPAKWSFPRTIPTSSPTAPSRKPLTYSTLASSTPVAACLPSIPRSKKRPTISTLLRA
ncbi:unnamed protein product [Linum tenue]|uniref:Uncharacterized protein n=1 Tax=Linum tenue TaxID=586396 RepID=A0AAV0MPJ6_9ROSI|nr:unnamed protein product [Linum tenue]